MDSIDYGLKTEAPHTHKGLRQFNRDVTKSLNIAAYLLGALLLLSFASFDVSASTMLPQKIRKAILNKHLPHVVKYESCFVETVKHTKLPEMLFLSILLQENGRTGKYSTNKNKTRDYGIGQINDVRASEIAEIGLTIPDVLEDGCKNIIGVAYLLSKEFKKSNGDLWTAVGNYHYSKYGPYPKHHYNYIKRIHGKWSLLYETVKKASRDS